MDFVTSFQPAVLPESDPVTPQSTTPLFSAGTTSANAMLTAVAPTPPRKSRIVLLNTRTFFPLKPSSPLITSRHQNTCGVLPPNASNFAPQFFCSCRSITVRYASHAARALSGSSVSPARSQASKRGSSPAIFEMSMPAKSITPSFKSRSIVLSSMPIWSSGVTSAVTAPFEASGIVLRQKGSSSTIETGVGLLRPMTLNCALGRSCAAAAEASAAASADPITKRYNIAFPPCSEGQCVTDPRRLAMAAAAAQTGSHDRDFRAASAVEKSMRYRLLLSQLLPAPGMRVLATRADVAVAILPAPTEAALAVAIADADGVVLVLERPRLTAEMVRAAPRLRVVCRCGAGYDNIDVTALTERGIPLATSGAANADTVEEHALYLMLALAKRGPLLDRAVKGGGWPREFGAVELRDRTCLVVGYGAIGRRIARLAAAFAMRVVVAD